MRDLPVFLRVSLQGWLNGGNGPNFAIFDAKNKFFKWSSDLIKFQVCSRGCRSRGES